MPGKFEKNESKKSFEFFCHHDPNPVVFKLVLHFDENEGSRVLQLGIALALGFSKAKSVVQLLSFKCLLHDHEKMLSDFEVTDKEGFRKLHRKKSEIRLPEFYKPGRTTIAETWRVTCQLVYSHDSERERSKPENSSGSTLKVQEDLVKMLEEPTNSDVTFLVGGERILAHKAILSARSEYFKAMFGSDVKENVLNEVDISDVEPKVFKGLLQFLYSGLPPKNLSEISLDLLVVADKYCVQEMEDLCEKDVCDNLDASDVVDALIVADKINNEKLMSHAKAVFRGHVDSVDEDAMKKLKENPELLHELMVHYCKE